VSLCVGTNGCGCAIQSSSLTITGSGQPGNPWTIEGAAPSLLTNAQRLALSGAELWDGRQVWTTDMNMLWEYTGTRWIMVHGRYGCSMTATAHPCPASALSSQVVWDVETFDAFNFVTAGADSFTIPTDGDGLYVFFVRGQAASSTFDVDTHFVVNVNTSIRRGGGLGVASAYIPVFCGLFDLHAGDELWVRVQNTSTAARNAELVLNFLRVGGS
jgi:hypothetical protein